MHVFYTPDLDLQEYYWLEEEEAKHCNRVLRLKKNDIIYLINGKGIYFEAEITDSEPKNCSLKIKKRIENFGKRNYFLNIAIAPTKDIERFEWFLEKAVEIGIDCITPILTSHSERKIIKPERLQKIIVTACKQSITAFKPKLEEMISFNEFIKNTGDTKKYIAHCSTPPKVLLKDSYLKNESITILIGPEGDFTDSEINLAMNNGFGGLSLGNTQLRTETAGIVACHSVAFMNQ